MDFWGSSADLKLIPALGNVREIPKVGFKLEGAEEAELRYPGLALRLGQFVRFHGIRDKPTGLYLYGLMVSPNWPVASLGLLQIDHPIGMIVGYSLLGLWLSEHKKVEVLLHPGLRRYLEGYKPLEGVHYV